ncbi:Zea mays Retrotransposon Opie-2 [Phytophthora cinnamomi]|uniref:Zea mays Retrotransposon Opie-2 n=1 Tax=Phytophthora cinnamomi TaxID=4785 RepID=UPI0035596F98|nr:Zea mays Retrotransposon Opie-2 [Phytophthora cinnamomi]
MVMSTRGRAAAAANDALQANPIPPAAQANPAQPAAQPANAPQVAAQPAVQDEAPAIAAALDPAIMAQIVSAGPALTALAAAFGANRSDGGNQRSQPQPEQEPNGDAESDGEAGTNPAAEPGKRSDKVDLRNIKVERFDGTVASGSFDAKAREFCEDLDEQMDLTGMACIARSGIAERINKERKGWNETYREYADRLRQMADALEGGKAVPANARHALVAHRKAETDGRLPERKKAKAAPHTAPTAKSKFTKPASKKLHQTPAKDKKNPKKRAAEAKAAVVERKKKKKTKTATNVGSEKASFTCYVCGQAGHTAAYHRRYLSGDAEAKEKKAEANQAAAQSFVNESSGSE